MAAASDIVKELNEVTSCSICMETFVDPKTLPCLHILCNACIESLVSRARAENRSRINCPLCKQQTPIPTPPDQFPVSFLTNSLVDLLVKTKSTGTTKCHPCSTEGDDTSATWICIQCVDLLCKSCKKYHDRYQKEHVCIEINSLTADTIKDISKKKQQHNCPEHDKELEYICEQCEEMLCVTCKIAGDKHQNHKTLYVKSKDVAERHKARVHDFNAKGDGLVDKYTACLQEIQQDEIAKDDEIDACVSRMETRYQEMCKILKEHKEDLITQAEKTRHEYHAMANEESSKLNLEIEHLKLTLENTKAVEREGSYMDIVHCSVQEIKQLEEMVASSPTNKVKDVVLEEEFDGDIGEIKALFGQLTSATRESSSALPKFKLNFIYTPTGLDLTKDGNLIVAEYSTTNVQIIARDGTVVSHLDKNSPLKQAWNVVHHSGYTYVSCCASGDIYVYDTNNKYCRTIEVGAKPRPGIAVWQSTLYITSYREGCVYSMSLNEPRSKRVFAKHPDLRGPSCVATNGQTVAVSCSSNNILIFNMDSQLQYKHGGEPKDGGNSQLNKPHGVVVDRKGYSIIADYNNRCLVVLSKSGQVHKVFHIKGKPEALVLDNHNEGTVIATTWEREVTAVIYI